MGKQKFKVPKKASVLATRPEIALLLCCARTQIDTATTVRIEALLQQGINWAHLTEIADHHRIIPLLYQSLTTTCSEAVPKDILAQLRNRFHSNAIRNLSLTQELIKLLDLFKSQNIAVLPFKGLVLAASAYGNLALRQFCDIDIIVREQDIPKAQKVLLSCGYQLQKNLGWEYQFIHKDSYINIDLHQAFVPAHFNLQLDFEELQSRLETLSIAGTRIPNILPEDSIWLLSMQLGKDCCHWNVRLRQLCDVAELIRANPKLDWSRLLEQAHDLGCERMLLLNLFLVSELLEVPLPQEVLERLETDSISKSLATQVNSWLWNEAGSPSEETGLWSFFWSYNHYFYLSMRELQQDRLIYCLYWLRTVCYATIRPTEADRTLIKLPQALYFLYYPFHLARLTVKHGIKDQITKMVRISEKKQIKGESK